MDKPIIVRSEEEVNRVLEWCMEVENTTHLSGMSFEEGVREMHEWLTGESNTAPNGDES